MRTAWVAVIVAACGGGGSEPPPAASARVISAIAPPAGSDDLQVATVNGRPVWGSCVAAQVSRGATSRQSALDECVAFELMAQDAEKRGIAADPSVADATRTAMVNRTVEAYEATHTTPASLGAVMTKWLDANAWRMHRPELRASTYARVLVKAGGPADLDARAHALADKIATALAGETGLFGVDVKETAERVAAGTGLKIEVADVPVSQRTKLDATYADALFGVAEIGRASGAVRTPWGWDVIAWTGGLPPQELTRDELAAGAFPELQKVAFSAWVNSLIKQLGVHITIDQTQVAKLAGGAS